MDPVYTPIAELGVALAAGLLIGLERETAKGEAAEAREGARRAVMGGVRTHPLFSLGGAITMLLVPAIGPWVFSVSFAGFAAFAVISYANDRRMGQSHGVTTEAAFLLSFLLGALATADGVLEPTPRLALVASIATIVALLLSLKEKLHGWVRRISTDDLAATLKFLIVSVVFLPLLPDRSFGPLGVLNPYKVGWMIVLIAGLSFVGYVAVRALGPNRGIGLTGFIGGIASSTAVTLTFSSRAKSNPELAPLYAMAVVLASTIMFVRVIIAVAVVNPSLVRELIMPLSGMALTGLGASSWLYFNARPPAIKSGGVEVTNPFDLSIAVKFGAIYALVLFASKAATVYLGTGGVYLTGTFAGAAEVDAITLSMAEHSLAGFDRHTAATTIVLGAAANTLTKGVLAIVLGGGTYAKQVALSLGAIMIAGIVAVLVG
ncbi:MAG: MgtC/SapB family protein [Deltaproteobacteria bacterium]|nr:MgtC/SapB family protein [Deltaproteobacteria bacterium]